ncbi:MAG: AlpA family phage regulatory protein [Novosphingobium sp.]|jgi:prophage regulatory protein|nr:AlpA family phage regulatory protein [Novosphingobium sp.]
MSLESRTPGDEAKPIRLIRLAEVKRRTGMSTSTIYRWMKVGKFPKSFPIEGYIVVWSELEIQKWIDSIIE